MLRTAAPLLQRRFWVRVGDGDHPRARVLWKDDRQETAVACKEWSTAVAAAAALRCRTAGAGVGNAWDLPPLRRHARATAVGHIYMKTLILIS